MIKWEWCDKHLIKFVDSVAERTIALFTERILTTRGLYLREDYNYSARGLL